MGRDQREANAQIKEILSKVDMEITDIDVLLQYLRMMRDRVRGRLKEIEREQRDSVYEHMT